MDSKTSEKNQENIKLIEDIAEIIKGISYIFSYGKLDKDEDYRRRFLEIGQKFLQISKLLEERKKLFLV